jgi:hypothetical protein
VFDDSSFHGDDLGLVNISLLIVREKLNHSINGGSHRLLELRSQDRYCSNHHRDLRHLLNIVSKELRPSKSEELVEDIDSHNSGFKTITFLFAQVHYSFGTSISFIRLKRVCLFGLKGS